MEPKPKHFVPEYLPQGSSIANDSLRLAAIAEQLAREGRTLVNHLDGRAENVSEHSNMLNIIAVGLAERYYPELDLGQIARFCPIHDLIESYTGDVPTHNFEEVDYPAKEAAEASAMVQFEVDFNLFPELVALVKAYVEQQIPEARFVRVVDKIMPLLMHFQDRGATLATYTNRQTMLDRLPSARTQYLRQEYPEFEELIRLREELSRLAAETLLAQ